MKVIKNDPKKSNSTNGLYIKARVQKRKKKHPEKTSSTKMTSTRQNSQHIKNKT
jgi:hypothetical protein